MFKPLRKRGLFLMKLKPESTEDTSQHSQEIPQPADVDLDLVHRVCEMIPDHTWPAVLNAAVANIVDELPMETMFKMCELYLIDYYLQNPTEIIPDMFRIKGEESTLYILDSLQLDKIPVPKQQQEITDDQSTDSAPCSIDPQ